MIDVIVYLKDMPLPASGEPTHQVDGESFDEYVKAMNHFDPGFFVFTKMDGKKIVINEDKIDAIEEA